MTRPSQDTRQCAELQEKVKSLQAENTGLRSISMRAHEMAEEAERRAAELDTIIESMNEGVVVSDPQRRVLRFNQREVELLGLRSREEMPATSFDFLRFRPRSPDGRPLEPEDLPGPRALRGETFGDQEIVIDTADGRERSLMIAGGPVRDSQGRIVLAVTLARDITEMRRAEREREDWVRMVSHDLRGPLTVVQGQAQILRRMPNRQDVVDRCAAAIVEAAKRMNAMIQDLTDVARLEMGKLEPNLQPIDLRDLLSAHIYGAAETLETSRIRLETPEKLPPVLADPHWLDRVLDNLLSNALKYSPPESWVGVSLGARDGRVFCEISDRGPGISPEDLPHIFERYYRGKLTLAARKEGLGLGLYITRLLVEALGGEVWARSELGKGSTFGFFLPRAPH